MQRTAGVSPKDKAVPMSSFATPVKNPDLFATPSPAYPGMPVPAESAPENGSETLLDSDEEKPK